MSERLQAELKKLHREVKIKPVFGDGKEVTYHLVPLKHKEAKDVFHDVLFSVFGVLAEVGNQEMDGFALGKIMRALKKELDKDTFFALAERLLRGAVRDDVEIRDIVKDEYYDENPLELYQIVLFAIMENWPNYFGLIRQVLSGFDLSEKMKDLAP
jgi:hypothetical protein